MLLPTARSALSFLLLLLALGLVVVTIAGAPRTPSVFAEEEDPAEKPNATEGEA